MKCSECKDLLVEAIYNELPQKNQEPFHSHLKECEKCNQAHREMKETLSVMNQRVRKDPGSAFWDNYWKELAPKLQETRQDRKVLFVPKRIPTWAYQVAAAVILLLLGVLIGKNYFTKPETPPQIVRTTPQEPNVIKASANDRAHRFLQRSELLLLGFVNSPGAESHDVAYSRKVSGELIQEAKHIEPTLNSPEQRKLRRLVSDLQIILLQIANLEEQHDLPEIEMVKSGTERTGILLQINLELMRAANQNGAAKKTEGVKEESAKRKL